jgi:hypothetical protein
MLSLDDFSPVTLESRAIIDRYLQLYPQVHSDNTTINMLCWNHYAHYHYTIQNDSLIIMTIVDGERTFRPPIGRMDDLLLSELISLAFREGGEIPIQMLDEETLTRVRNRYPDLPIYQDRDFADYIYLSTDLANLSGKNYLTIRGQINKFKRTTTYSVEQITEDSIDGIKEFLERWCEWKHCDEFPILAHEKEAVIFAVDHFNELNCQGLFIRTDKDISAIAIWGIMNEETIVVHFEKALPDFEGIYKIINMKTAKAVQTRYRYINRESDMGVPGLREAKIRYHPHHMAPVWYIRRSDMLARKELY